MNNSKRVRTRDGFTTFDSRTIDAAGAFLIGELERLDPEMHGPLVDVTWGRDVDLREDVTIADETSSFTNTTFASAGGIAGPSSNAAYGNYGGKAFIGKDSNVITSMQLDIGKTALPLTLWGMELSYTIPELESAQRLGRPIDVQKFEGIRLKHQMDIDEMVYIGDSALGYTGLVNNASVSVINATTDSNSHTTWAQKLADDATGNVASGQITTDVNNLLTTAWQNSGWAVCPAELRIPPYQFGLLVSSKVSAAGNISLLEYLKQNTISNSINGKPLNIQPLKWLKGAGVSTADRMLAYTKDRRRVRFPLVPLQRTPLEYRSLFQITTYFGRLGVMEFPYLETVAYEDGI